MKLTDPSIELISCGQNGWSDWNRVVIEGLAPIVDYHSIHIYTGSADYYRNVFSPHQAERAIRICAALIEQARYNQRISPRSASPTTSGTSGTAPVAPPTARAASRSSTTSRMRWRSRPTSTSSSASARTSRSPTWPRW